MKLISEIISDLMDSEKSMTTPLLKTKVLATKIKNTILLDWVNHELSGYDIDEVPEYRRYTCQISGTFINGYTQYNDQPIPLIGLPEKFEELFRQVNFVQSITTLEKLVIDSDSEVFSPIPPEFALILQQNIKDQGNPFFNIINARRRVPIGVVTQILAIVRSKLLDFMLKLDEEFGGSTDIADMTLNNDKINHIMNQTIISTGDGNILNTGDSVQINATISLKKGDKDSLSKFLKTQNIDRKQVDDLMEIIDTETPEKTTGIFGPKVNSWIQQMIGKALDGTWKIGIGAAGTILAEAIQRYYGIK